MLTNVDSIIKMFYLTWKVKKESHQIIREWKEEGFPILSEVLSDISVEERE